MEKKLLMPAAFTLKILIVTGCIMYGFSAYAQSITGKWRLTAAKETITDAAGNKQDLTAQMAEITKKMEHVIELHADNTYFMSNKMVGAKGGVEVSGKYNVSGNHLKLQQGKSNMDVTKTSSPVNNTLPNDVNIVFVNSTTLVLHYNTTTTEDGKTFTIDIADTFMKQ